LIFRRELLSAVQYKTDRDLLAHDHALRKYYNTKKYVCKLSKTTIFMQKICSYLHIVKTELYFNKIFCAKITNIFLLFAYASRIAICYWRICF